MSDAAAIAGKLTRAQREAILRGSCGVPRLNDEWSADCICGASGVHTLLELNLAVRRVRYPHGIVLTREGLAVRQHLQQQEGQNDDR
jgi:hypothetical protein